MHSSKFLWLLATASFLPLVVFATGGGEESIISVGGVRMVESETYRLVFLEPTASFTDLIEKYLAEGGERDRIGGFTFVPNRFEIEEDGNRVAIDATVATGDPEVTDSSPPVEYGTYGYRVFLTYWMEDLTLTGGRSILFFGLDNAGDAFLIPAPDNSEGNYFLLDDLDPETFKAPDDQAFIRSVAEFELSYLPIEDFYYLAESESYYTDAQAAAIGPADRRLAIQRAVVAQTFDIGSDNVDSIYQYRTLSFRPHPYPEWSGNEEAGIAFKYGYYCPPYWGPQLTQSAAAPAEVEDAMMFFQFSATGEESATKADSLLTSLSLMLGGQLMSRETTVERFGGDQPDTLTDILARFWWVLVGLLIVAFLIGRTSKGDGTLLSSQNG